MSAKKDETGLDGPMRSAMISVAIAACALTIGTLVLYDLRAAGGTLIGGAIATANLYVFARLGKAFLSEKGAKGPWVAVALLKLTVLFGGVWWVLKTDAVPAIALAVGYAALPIGITLGTLLGPKPPDDTDTI